MRKYVVRFILLGALVLLYFAGLGVLNLLDVEYAKPRTLAFELPLPDDALNRLGLQRHSPLEIDKVILSGFFSDWSTNDENYRMTQVSHKRWEISMKFPPGRNQYKFVVYTKKPVFDNQAQDETSMFWVEDRNAKIRIDDGFSGHNSVIDVGSTEDLRFFYNTAFLVLISIVLIYSVFTILIQYIMRLKLRLKYKIALCIVFVIVGSNALFIAYDNRQKADFIRHGLVEEANIIHQYLVSAGVDFQELDRPGTRETLRNGLTAFFDRVSARIEKRKTSNLQLMLSSLVVFDRDWNVIALQSERGARQILSFEAGKFGYKDMEDYFRRGIFGGLIASVASNRSWTPDFAGGSSPARLNQYRTQNDRDARPFFSTDIFLYPILVKNRVAGYYGGRINIQILGDEMRRDYFVNAVFLAVTLIVSLIFLFKVGDIISANIGELTSWSESIGKGDFSEHKKPASHDEIEKLADQFDRMRLSLSNNVHNLKLINLVTTKLQTVSRVDDLFNVFLTFVTANFGFHYNRGAIFLKEENRLVGRFAIGCLDEKELQRTFGSYANYSSLQIDINSFIEDTKPFMDNTVNSFTMAVREIAVPPEDESLLWDAMRERKPVVVRKEDRTEHALDTILRRRLNLEEYAIFPLYKGREPVGVLVVDNYFDRREITDDHVEQLRIAVSEFSLNLENKFVVGNLEQIVHDRTAQLEQEMLVTDEQRRKLDTALSELRMAYKVLQEKDRALSDDLSVAKLLQDKVLKRDLDRITDLNYSIYSRPGAAVGGDVYDIAKTGEKTFRVWIARAPGQGIQAALLSMIVKSEYEKLKLLIKNPAELLEMLNNEFIRVYKFLGVFFSCMVVDIDREAGKITYASAGHPAQYLVRDEGAVTLISRGKMIGAQEDIRYLEDSAMAGGRSKLLLFTEGLLKSQDGQGNLFPAERMAAIVQENRLYSIQRITDRIEEEIGAFTRNAKNKEDITLIGIEL